MRSISILRLYYTSSHIMIFELTNLEIILNGKENIAIWKENTNMFRALFHFFFIVEFKLFIDKKRKYNEKYQKKKFGLIFLVTLE